MRRAAHLDQLPEYRQRRAAQGGQDVEFLNHVLGFAVIAHHEAVSRDPAIHSEQEHIAEAPPGQGVVDDLAVHLLPV